MEDDWYEIQSQKTWYENGQIEAEINYKNGKQHGLSTWYHFNGELNYREEYANGNVKNNKLEKLNTKDSPPDFIELESLRKQMLLSISDLSSILGTSRMSYYTWLKGGNIHKSNIKKINSKINQLKGVVSKYEWPKDILELEPKERKVKLIELLNN